MRSSPTSTLGGYRWTSLEMITAIKSGSWAFFTHVNGRVARVVVVRTIYGEYLRTDADTTVTNNLLSLPRFL